MASLPDLEIDQDKKYPDVSIWGKVAATYDPNNPPPDLDKQTKLLDRWANTMFMHGVLDSPFTQVREGKIFYWVKKDILGK